MWTYFFFKYSFEIRRSTPMKLRKLIHSIISDVNSNLDRHAVYVDAQLWWHQNSIGERDLFWGVHFIYNNFFLWNRNPKPIRFRVCSHFNSKKSHVQSSVATTTPRSFLLLSLDAHSMHEGDLLLNLYSFEYLRTIPSRLDP